MSAHNGTERRRRELIRLSAELAAFRDMAIAGEGNVSCRLGDGRFLVKASGTNLGALRPEHLVEVASRELLDAIETKAMLDDNDVEQLLLAARVDASALKPSVESLFHAWLLHLDGVGVVAHAHPVAANAVLCSARAREFAERRLFPDQVVYCGPESVLVPYVDPGLSLAVAIAAAVESYRDRLGISPKTILIENHGVISLGGTVPEAAAGLMMAEKSARVFLDAAALGGPVYMTDSNVARIDGRVDEHYRRRLLRDG